MLSTLPSAEMRKPDEARSSSPTSARQRNRASAACIACRKTRVRCVLRPSESTCTSCKSNGLECLFNGEDGRKSRATSKAFAEGLNSRILQIESVLREQLTSSAPSNDHENISSPTGREASLNGSLHLLASAAGMEGLSASRGDNRATDSTVPTVTNGTGVFDPPETTTSTATDPSQELITKLSPCPVRFDMASGRLRFFGPTTNLHILSNTICEGNLERHESHWPIAMLIRDLYPETHDYLMDLFWTCHNSVFHLVHKDAFYEDLESGGTQWYSIFLHFCMLASAFRYSDKARLDIQRHALTGQFSSTFHAKAKSMAKFELDRPGGIPSLQALFLLGELEASSGRDDTGWMFAGMAFRLVWDIGLHVDASDLGLSDRDEEIRRMVLWYATVSDKHWALYLGRPTTLKMTDIAPSCLSKDFTRMINSRPVPYGKTAETRVYEALLRLLDLLEPLCESVRKPATSTDGYLRIAALDRELEGWYAQLPENLMWNERTIANAPASFFLLHTQYHAALILLHRPYVKYEVSHRGAGRMLQSNDHFTVLSRTVCIDNAKRIASIFRSYRSRFDIAQVFLTGPAHAGAAATALMAEIVSYADPSDCSELVDHLEYLKETIGLMSKTYQPAAMMTSVVEHFLKDIEHARGDSELTAGRLSGAPSAPPVAAVQPTSAGDMSQKRAWSARISSSQRSGSTTPIPLHNKRPRIDILNPRTDLHSQGLPFLPSSWLEEVEWEDTQFLNLMGLKGLQAIVDFAQVDGVGVP